MKQRIEGINDLRKDEFIKNFSNDPSLQCLIEIRDFFFESDTAQANKEEKSKWTLLSKKYTMKKGDEKRLRTLQSVLKKIQKTEESVLSDKLKSLVHFDRPD